MGGLSAEPPCERGAFVHVIDIDGDAFDAQSPHQPQGWHLVAVAEPHHRAREPVMMNQLVRSAQTDSYSPTSGGEIDHSRQLEQLRECHGPHMATPPRSVRLDHPVE